MEGTTNSFFMIIFIVLLSIAGVMLPAIDSMQLAPSHKPIIVSASTQKTNEGIMSYDEIRNQANDFSEDFSLDGVVNKFRNMSIPVAITAVVIFGFLIFIGIWFKQIRKFTMMFLLGTSIMFLAVNFTETIVSVLFAFVETILNFFTSFGNE